MSMTGGFRTVAPRALAILRAHPHFSDSLLDFGSPDLPGAPGVPLPVDVSAMMKGLPPEMAQQLQRQLGSTLLQSFGPGGTRNADAEAEIAALGIGHSDLGEAISIEKAWHGLHYLLAGTPWEPSAGAGSAVLGGVEVGEDLGYGPLRALEKDEVASIATALEAISTDELTSRYRAEDMEALEVYPGGWSDSENLPWLLSAFEEVRNYFLLARKNQMAMLLYIT